MKKITLLFLFISSFAFAASCKTGQEKLSCAVPQGIGKAPGYPTALVLCQTGASLNVEIDILGADPVTQDVTPSAQGTVLTPADAAGYLITLVSSSDKQFAYLTKGGGNMGIMQCN